MKGREISRNTFKFRKEYRWMSMDVEILDIDKKYAGWAGRSFSAREIQAEQVNAITRVTDRMFKEFAEGLRW